MFKLIALLAISLPLESRFAVDPVKATTNKTKQIILKYLKNSTNQKKFCVYI